MKGGVHDGRVETLGHPAFDRATEFVRVVPVASRDRSIKLAFSAPTMCGGFVVDSGAPERAFDIGESRRVRAVAAWGESRAALEEDVESEAAGLGGAFGGAEVDVVAFGGVDDYGAEGVCGAGGGFEVLEGLVIACWGRVGVVGDQGGGWVGSE